MCAHQPQCVGTSRFLGSTVASNLEESRLVSTKLARPLALVGLASRYVLVSALHSHEADQIPAAGFGSRSAGVKAFVELSCNSCGEALPQLPA